MDDVPIRFRTVSGVRPFVKVKLNGRPFLFMVHANASFYAMTTHANARRAAVAPLHPLDTYGISSIGHVSGVGRFSATLRRLEVGRSIVRDSRILVFEVPQKPVMDGMLGMGWLRDRNALVDFRSSRIRLPGIRDDAESERARLLASGYRAYPLEWNEGRKAFVLEASINGSRAKFVVSTVAEMIVDTRFATAARIATGPVTSTYGGPTGTSGEVRLSAGPVGTLLAGTPTRPVTATVYDVYAYEAQPRPSDPDEVVGGYLGCDFMLANGAVIDFGSGTLFLR